MLAVFGRILVRMSRGGQAVAVSKIIDSYREATKNLELRTNALAKNILVDQAGHAAYA